MFNWKKLGQIFNPTVLNNYGWMQEQAQNPFILDMGKFIRVYFNTRAKRDNNGKSTSLPGFVDLDRFNITRIINISAKPIMTLGEQGSFDEFGVMAGSIIRIEGEYYLYYCGWTRMISVPYNWSIGLAKSNNGDLFTRFGIGPILGAVFNEPYLQAGCTTILKVEDTYHLWYTSGIKWINTEEKPESVYQIMHATSNDGISWLRDGKPIVTTLIENESQPLQVLLKLTIYGICFLAIGIQLILEIKIVDTG